MVEFYGKEGRAQAETCAQLGYAGHMFTRCNVNQVTLLDLNSLDVTWVPHERLLIAWTKPEAILAWH